MAQSDSLFQHAAARLLSEILEGTTNQDGFVLNPGDSGLLGQLETISAAEASAMPTGRSTIAAHVGHVRYGLTLLNRWAAGEENPFASADWDDAWKRTTVDETQWHDLREHLRAEATTWQEALASRSAWDEIAAAGALASIVHTAYHLGAIRQMLLTQRRA